MKLYGKKILPTLGCLALAALAGATVVGGAVGLHDSLDQVDGLHDEVVGLGGLHKRLLDFAVDDVVRLVDCLPAYSEFPADI